MMSLHARSPFLRNSRHISCPRGNTCKKPHCQWRHYRETEPPGVSTKPDATSIGNLAQWLSSWISCLGGDRDDDGEASTGTGLSTPSTGSFTCYTPPSTPSTRSSTPTPRRGWFTLRAGTSTPSTGSSSPRAGSSTPSTRSSTPSSGTSTPYTPPSTPSTRPSTPRTGWFTPSTGSTSPRAGSFTPSTGSSCHESNRCNNPHLTSPTTNHSTISLQTAPIKGHLSSGALEHPKWMLEEILQRDAGDAMWEEEAFDTVETLSRVCGTREEVRGLTGEGSP